MISLVRAVRHSCDVGDSLLITSIFFWTPVAAPSGNRLTPQQRNVTLDEMFFYNAA
jgi:hypothetical protein